MKSLTAIRQQLQDGSFEFTRHAFKRAIERNISEQELREIGETVEIIEDYPDDKYSPSSLLLGFTQSDRALHIQVSRIESDTTKIITLYEPNQNEWIQNQEKMMFKCYVCGSEESHTELASEIFQIDGKFHLVENIPATVCSRCGEEIFSRETTERIRAMLHGAAEPITSISMDVFSYQPESKVI